MAKAGRPTREQSDHLTARIVAVATRLFLEKGYADTTIDELAQRLGVAKRSVYSRFSDKAALFRLVTTTYAEQALSRLTPIMIDDRPLEEQLRTACLDLLGLFLEPDVIAMERVVVSEARRFPEIVPILETARLSAMAYLYPLLVQLGCGPAKETVQEQAQILWDLVIAAAVRATALDLRLQTTRGASELFVTQRITLFLHGLSALQARDAESRPAGNHSNTWESERTCR